MIVLIALLAGAALLMTVIALLIAWTERKPSKFDPQERERVGYRTSQGRKMMPPRNPMISHRKRRGW